MIQALPEANSEPWLSLSFSGFQVLGLVGFVGFGLGFRVCTGFRVCMDWSFGWLVVSLAVVRVWLGGFGAEGIGVGEFKRMQGCSKQVHKLPKLSGDDQGSCSTTDCPPFELRKRLGEVLRQASCRLTISGWKQARTKEQSVLSPRKL